MIRYQDIVIKKLYLTKKVTIRQQGCFTVQHIFQFLFLSIRNKITWTNSDIYMYN